LFFNYFQELQKQREDEIDSLKTEYNNLLAKIDNLELDVKKITASMKQMDEQMSTQTQQNIDKEESYKVKKRTLELLPDAENNIGKIQVIK
jgi:outer membrane murein-binding lipoprotein Lpp